MVGSTGMGPYIIPFDAVCLMNESHTLSEPPEKVAVIPVINLQQLGGSTEVLLPLYTTVRRCLCQNEALPLLLSAAGGLSERARIEAVKTRAVPFVNASLMP